MGVRDALTLSSAGASHLHQRKRPGTNEAPGHRYVAAALLIGAAGRRA
jgi:hypothetical protein